MRREVATAAVWQQAVTDPHVVGRYWRHVRSQPAPDSGCLLWTGAISGGGHGRFWLGTNHHGRDVCVLAHRYRWGLAYGYAAVLNTPVVRHDCDVPLCQNLDHLRAGTPSANRHDWVNRREEPGSPLHDRRGPRGRAVALRNAARGSHTDLYAAIQDGLTPLDIDQLPLWAE